MTSFSDRQDAVKLIDEAISNGAGKTKACDEMGIGLRSYNRWVKNAKVTADRRPSATRPSPKNKLTESQTQAVICIANSEAYKSRPPSQIVPALADEGRYVASVSSFYRILHAAGQQHHRGRHQKAVRKPLSTHRADKPNKVWCWDITWLPGPAKGIFFFLYLIIDLYSRKVVGWEVYETESSEQASELVKKASARANIPPDYTLVLHSDNGSPMKGSSLQATLYNLKINPSFSRPRVSNDNAHIESFFRTCKYRPDYPYKGFVDIDAAQTWVMQFVTWYNDEHKHSSLKFVTPSQRYDGTAQAICEKRHAVFEAAKRQHPERWSGKTRDWTLPDEVWLNPEKEPTNLKQVA